MESGIKKISMEQGLDNNNDNDRDNNNNNSKKNYYFNFHRKSEEELKKILSKKFNIPIDSIHIEYMNNFNEFEHLIDDDTIADMLDSDDVEEIINFINYVTENLIMDKQKTMLLDLVNITQEYKLTSKAEHLLLKRLALLTNN